MHDEHVAAIRRRLREGRPLGVPIEVPVLVLIGAALRLYHLGHESLWLDEVFTVGVATEETPAAILFELPRVEPHPPGHNLLMWAWVGLTGTSEVALRLTSVAAGVATIPVLYVLVRRWFDREVATVATLLFVVSPLQIWYAQEARMYAMLVFLATLSFLLVVRFLEEPSPRRAGAYLAVGAAMGYLHVYALFVLLAQVLYVGWRVFGGFHAVRATPRRAASVYAGMGVLLAPWLAVLAHRAVVSDAAAAERINWLQPPGSLEVWETFQLLSFGITTETLPYATLAAPPRVCYLGVFAAVLLFIGGLNLGLFGDRFSGVALVVLWLVVPIVLPLVLSHLVVPIYELRYAIVAAPAFLIVLAVGLRVLPHAGVRYLLVALVVTGMVLPLPAYYDEHQKDEWADAAASIEDRADAGDAVIVVRPGTLDAFERYFERDDVAVGTTWPPDEPPPASLLPVDGDTYVVVAYMTDPQRATFHATLRDVTGGDHVDHRSFVSIDVFVYRYQRTSALADGR